MIKLTRIRTTQAIPAGFRGTRRVTRSRELLDLKRAGGEPSSNVWKAAKKQLKIETDGKCAYCEGKASHVAHGDVEHFRPKSEYWWLAYCYDNFLYSCEICNQSYKGSKFPCTGTVLATPLISEPATEAELAALAATFGVDPLDLVAVPVFDAVRLAEQAGIPDPYLVDPGPLLAWEADDTLREVVVRARNNSIAARRAFAAVRDCLGLNRDELRRWRYEIYDFAMTFVLTVQDPGISAALRTRTENQLRRMMSSTGEFAGMVRHFVRDVEGLQL